MAQYNVTLDEEKIKELLIHDHGLKALVEAVVNQVLEAQMTDQIRAGKYELRRGERPTATGIGIGGSPQRVSEACIEDTPNTGRNVQS